MDIENLIRMVNRIGDFLRSQPAAFTAHAVPDLGLATQKYKTRYLPA